MASAISKSLQFSGCHGHNVVLSHNGTVARGEYIHAHGQFITLKPLSLDQRMELKLSGTGIVKINSFPSRGQAVDWVRSRQPLSLGSRRVRLSGSVIYSVIIPQPGQCVLFESVRDSQRNLFTLAAGPYTILGFDIVYGDVVVSIATSSSGVKFDTFCHSCRVDISCTLGVSSAQLCHYNPSSLCSLENVAIKPGDVFMLDVVGSEENKDTGSYVRVGVAKQQLAYVNSVLSLCSGKSSHNSKRILIAPGVSKKLFVRVVPEGILISKQIQSQILDSLILRLQHDHTLWFEIHKVTLKVFHISENPCHYQELALPTFSNNSQIVPPPRPPPPLPPRTVGYGRHPPHELPCTPTDHNEHQKLTLTHISQHISKTVSSKENNPCTCPNCFRSYVSASACNPSDKPTNVRSCGQTKCFYCGTIIQSDFCSSVSTNAQGSEFNVLFSQESHSTVQSPERQDINIACESHYEMAENLWLKPTMKAKHKDNNAVDSLGNINQFLMSTETQETCSYCKNILAQAQKSDSTANSLPVVTDSTDNSLPVVTDSTDNSLLVVTDSTDNSSQQHKHCLNWTHQVEVNKTKTCDEKDVGVNINQDGCLSGNNKTVAKQGHFERLEKTSYKICSQLDNNCNQINSIQCLQTNGSEVQTSSVWLRETDLDSVTMQHALDIHIEPVQGKLRCCSNYSNTRSNNNNITQVATAPDRGSERMSSLLDKPILDTKTENALHELRTTSFEPENSNSVDSTFSIDTPVKCQICEFDNDVTDIDIVDGDITNGDVEDDDVTSNKNYPDEITLLKCVASGDNPGLTSISTQLKYVEETSNISTQLKTTQESLNVSDKPSNSSASHTTSKNGYNFAQVPSKSALMPMSVPKPCNNQTFNEYLLAAPIVSEQTSSPINSHNYNSPDLDKNLLEKCINDNVDESLVNVNDVKDEQPESDMVVLRRYNWRYNRQNITESIISNTSKARLSFDLEVRPPTEAVAPFRSGGQLPARSVIYVPVGPTIKLLDDIHSNPKMKKQ